MRLNVLGCRADILGTNCKLHDMKIGPQFLFVLCRGGWGCFVCFSPCFVFCLLFVHCWLLWDFLFFVVVVVGVVVVLAYCLLKQNTQE